MRIVRLLEGSAGRGGRAVAGGVLVGLGAWLGGGWWALVAFGVVAISAGLFDFCLAAPLLGAPIRHDR